VYLDGIQDTWQYCNISSNCQLNLASNSNCRQPINDHRVLVNGYTPACMALACHRLAAPHPGDGGGGGLAGAIARLQSRGFALNEEGGAVVRASEDGLLLQSATVADLIEFWFAGEREVGRLLAHWKYACLTCCVQQAVQDAWNSHQPLTDVFDFKKCEA
jgi:hypothetical protein